jgi:hypothetical protein
MNMHPDKTLVNDLSIFILGSSMVLLLIYIMSSSSTGYPPADQCAQTLRTTLSPYQAQALTESDEMPISYETAHSWCEAHINSYATEITRATSWPMYPAVDMYSEF